MARTVRQPYSFIAELSDRRCFRRFVARSDVRCFSCTAMRSDTLSGEGPDPHQPSSTERRMENPGTLY